MTISAVYWKILIWKAIVQWHRIPCRIQLDNENGELNPIPVSRDVGISVPELDPLTQILKEFHDAFGGIDWTDEDKVKKQVADLPAIVSKDEAYQNAIKNSDAQNARVESDRATMQAILDSMVRRLNCTRQ